MDKNIKKANFAKANQLRKKLSAHRLVEFLFNEAVDPIIIADTESGLHVECNPAAELFFGYSRDELIGMHQAQLHLNKDLPGELSRDFVKQLKHPTRLSEVQMITASGEVRITSVRTSLIEVDGSKLIVGIFRDVTELKEAEDKVAQRVAFERATAKLTLELLRLPPDKVNNGLVVALEEIGTYSKVDRVGLFLLNEGTSVVGDVYEWFSPGCDAKLDCLLEVDLTKYIPILWEEIEKKGLYQADDIPAQFGELARDLGCSSILVGSMFNSGLMVGFICLGTEFSNRIWSEEDRDILRLYCENMAIILDRKWSEEELERSREDLFENQAKLSLAMEMSQMAPWEQDLASGEFTFNDQFYDLYKTTAEREGGYKIAGDVFVQEFFHPDDLHVLDAELEAISESGDMDLERILEHRIIRRDGEVRHIKVRYRLFRNSKGEPVKTIGANQDITESKLVEKELEAAKIDAEAASKAKSNFLANMSHEIRTPMNGIIGMTHLLKKKGLPVEHLDYLNKIETSANSLLGIINDILDLSKVEAGMLTIEKINFNLATVLEELSSIIFPQASEKKLEFLIAISPDVPMNLIGDPLRLSQLLVNLCSNAVKYTDHGEVLVKIHKVQQESPVSKLRFSVKDDGIGISKNKIDDLFEPFTQADSSTTRKYGGTGLGLNLCRQLVSLMGGSISAESEPGIGSTFWFDISFEESVHSSVASVVHEEIRGRSVLIVDDNPTSLTILKAFFSQFGLNSVVTDSAAKALVLLDELANDQKIDLLVTDWRMPGMDGIELSEHVIRNSSYGVPADRILIVSAYSSPDLLKQTQKMGLMGLLYKPVSQSLLYNILVEAFGVAKGYGLNSEGAEEETFSLHGVKVLLVEDNELNREIAYEILNNADVVVFIAENGREAVDFLQAAEVDLVLMDIQMPVMDGFEATRRLRQSAKFKDLPIIAMTAHAMAKDREDAAVAGMNDHISKPFDPDKLLETIKKWTDKKAESSTEVLANEAIAEVVLPAELPGINMELGLRSTRGKKHKYRKYLLQFRDKYQNLPDELRLRLAEGNFSEAADMVHSVKSTAGMLGAWDVYETANLVEISLVSGKKELELVNDFCRNLEKVLLGLSENIKDDAGEPPTTVNSGKSPNHVPKG